MGFLPFRRAAHGVAGLALLILFAPFPLGAEVYKWVDEQGRTQYGESPPPGAKASKLAAPPSAPPAPPESPEKWHQQDNEFRKRQIERNTKETQEQQARARSESECTQAKNKLSWEEQPGRHWQQNDAGERIFLSDEAQARAVEAARRRVNEACR
jgi:hypothetical protein